MISFLRRRVDVFRDWRLGDGNTEQRSPRKCDKRSARGGLEQGLAALGEEGLRSEDFGEEA